MSWPTAFCGATGEQELVDEIAATLQKRGALEIQVLSKQFAERFNRVVRLSPWSPYAENRRNDGSFKKWLKDCGFDVGQMINGNQAWVYAPETWDSGAWEEDWHSTAHNAAIVELSSWGIGDAGIVDIFKQETCNVMYNPGIRNSETVHLRRVNLQENRLSDAGVEELVECFLQLRLRMDVLKLYKNPGISNRGACKLAKLYGMDCRPPPKELHLSDCSVHEQGASELLVAIAHRWRNSDLWSKAARPAYVRLDNNPFSLDQVQDYLYSLNFYLKQVYDPRRQHDGCEVYELAGGPSLITLPFVSFSSASRYSHSGHRQQAWEPETPDQEGSYPKTQPGETTGLSVFQENLANPPPDVEGLPIQRGCTVQYHDDPNWIGVVVGFDYKGTAVVAWHHGAKKGTRTTAGSKYLRIVTPVDAGAASSQEAVLPKEQEAKPSWETLQARLFAEPPSAAPYRHGEQRTECSPVSTETWQAREMPIPERRPEPAGDSLPVSQPQEPRDCGGLPLRKDQRVQYHDDPNWVGVVVGFSSKDSLTVVEWLSGGKAGKRTFASGRYLRIVSREADEAPQRWVEDVIGVIGRSEDARQPAVAAWHGLSGL
ncbi:unnamed protein product [Durusdinium trenchii]|uniref:Tubulin-folding cofactor E n=2 Tax=Durusdinium trenchii TaxID=1381693 RepID=A0ABP0S8K1_9DINO